MWTNRSSDYLRLLARASENTLLERVFDLSRPIGGLIAGNTFEEPRMSYRLNLPLLAFFCVWQEHLVHFGGLIWPTLSH